MSQRKRNWLVRPCVWALSLAAIVFGIGGYIFIHFQPIGDSANTPHRVGTGSASAETSPKPSVSLVAPVTKLEKAGLANKPKANRPVGTPNPLGCAPERLVIRSIGVNTSVLRLGRASDGSPAVPDDAQRMDAAWYRFGPKPGAARGNVIVVGHSYHDAMAVFNNLPAVRKGDLAKVTTTCGTVLYRSVKIDRNVPKTLYPQRVAPWVNNFTGSPRLITTTCSGDWNWLARTHLDVTVVAWKPVSYQK